MEILEFKDINFATISGIWKVPEDTQPECALTQTFPQIYGKAKRVTVFLHIVLESYNDTIFLLKYKQQVVPATLSHDLALNNAYPPPPHILQQR